VENIISLFFWQGDFDSSGWVMYMAVWYRLLTYRFVRADMNQKAPSISTQLITLITNEKSYNNKRIETGKYYTNVLIIEK